MQLPFTIAVEWPTRDELHHLRLWPFLADVAFCRPTHPTIAGASLTVYIAPCSVSSRCNSEAIFGVLAWFLLPRAGRMVVGGPRLSLEVPHVMRPLRPAGSL